MFKFPDGERGCFLTPQKVNTTAGPEREHVGRGRGINLRFLIHDRDAKYPESFDEHFHRDKGGVVKTPYLAPIANSLAESWIGSMKRECLNFFLCFSLRQLDHTVQIYARYHNEFRLHQALGNNRRLGSIEPARRPWGQIS